MTEIVKTNQKWPILRPNRYKIPRTAVMIQPPGAVAEILGQRRDKAGDIIAAMKDKIQELKK